MKYEIACIILPTLALPSSSDTMAFSCFIVPVDDGCDVIIIYDVENDDPTSFFS
jgi:hypothetical protein